MAEQVAFTEGFVAPNEAGQAQGAPGIDWREYANGGTVGYLRAADGWLFSMAGIALSRTPEGCDVIVWPSTLFRVSIPEGTPAVDWNCGRVLASGVRVVSAEDPGLILGNQRDELLDMAATLLDVTQVQQREMAALSAERTIANAARLAVRTIAEDAGRYNSVAAMQALWNGCPQLIWARDPIGGAAMAVAHRDLLHELELWDQYGEVLYRPWREVMGAGQG